MPATSRSGLFLARRSASGFIGSPSKSMNTASPAADQHLPEMQIAVDAGAAVLRSPSLRPASMAAVMAPRRRSISCGQRIAGGEWRQGLRTPRRSCWAAPLRQAAIGVGGGALRREVGIVARLRKDAVHFAQPASDDLERIVHDGLETAPWRGAGVAFSMPRLSCSTTR